MRQARLKRETGETRIDLTLNIDGTGLRGIDTGIGFLDHALSLLAKHAYFDLNITARGDLQTDCHHVTEDTGIVLGEAFNAALSDKKGITRYGHIILPMDEACIICAVDLSGRAFLNFDVKMPQAAMGAFDACLVEEFFRAFSSAGRFNAHFLSLSGKNAHHIAEACFKGLGRALSQAAAINPKETDVPSTKGVLV